MEGLALPHDLAVQAANFYQPGFGKPQVDRTRDGFRNRYVTNPTLVEICNLIFLRLAN